MLGVVEAVPLLLLLLVGLPLALVHDAELELARLDELHRRGVVARDDVHLVLEEAPKAAKEPAPGVDVPPHARIIQQV